MLNKIILGGIIAAVIIIAAAGLYSVINKSEKPTTDDQSINQEQHIPKKITLDLNDGMNLGEAGR